MIGLVDKANKFCNFQRVTFSSKTLNLLIRPTEVVCYLFNQGHPMVIFSSNSLSEVPIYHSQLGVTPKVESQMGPQVTSI